MQGIRRIGWRNRHTRSNSILGISFLPEDTDEIITKVGCPHAKGCSLLSHCELRHLQMIVAENQMDLKLSGNLLLLTAAASCNIEAFLWLVSDGGINANQCRGPKEGSALHRAVTGSPPARKPEKTASAFFKVLFEVFQRNTFWKHFDGGVTFEHLMDIFSGPVGTMDAEHLITQRDADGRTVLHHAALIKTDADLMAVLLNPKYKGGQIFVDHYDKDLAFGPYEGRGDKTFWSVERTILKNVISWVDSKGKTAKEMCILVKNEKAASILDQFCFYLAFQQFSLSLSLSYSDEDKEHLTCDRIAAFFSQFGDMDTLKKYMTLDSFADSFLRRWTLSVHSCLFHGLIEQLNFLCDRLGFEVTLDSFPDAFEILLKDEYTSTFDPCTRDGSTHLRDTLLREMEHNVIWEWNGISYFEEFMKKKLIEQAVCEGPILKETEFEYDFYDCGCNTRTRMWEWKMMQVTDDEDCVKEALRAIPSHPEGKRFDEVGANGKEISEFFITNFEQSDIFRYCQRHKDKRLRNRKCALLNWLVQREMVASPHLFIVYKQPVLLQWMCDNHHFELDAPLDDNKFMSLREHVRTLDWLPQKEKGKKQSKSAKRKTAEAATHQAKDGNVLPNSTEEQINMRECSDLGDMLLFLSAGYGDLRTFEYVVSKRSEKILASQGQVLQVMENEVKQFWPDPNGCGAEFAADPDGSLHDAARYPEKEHMEVAGQLGHLPKVRKLLRFGLIFNAASSACSIENHDWIDLRKFLEKTKAARHCGQAVRITCAITYKGRPLLHVAASRGSSEIVKYLVNSVPVETVFDDVNAAHVAFSSGFQHIGQFLLEKGCSSVDLRGRDYLWFCKNSGLDHMVTFAENLERQSKVPRCEEDVNQLLAMLRNTFNPWESIREFLDTNETFTTRDSPVMFSDFDSGRLNELMQLVVAHSLEAVVYFVKSFENGASYRSDRGPGIFYNHGLTFQLESEMCGLRRFMMYHARVLGKVTILKYFSDCELEEKKNRHISKLFRVLRTLFSKGADLVDIEEQIAEIMSLGLPHDHKYFTSGFHPLIDHNGKPKRGSVDDIFLHGKSTFQYFCSQRYGHLIAWRVENDSVSKKDLQKGLMEAIIPHQKVFTDNFSVVAYLLNRCGSDIQLDTALSGLLEAVTVGHLKVVQVLFQHVVDNGGDPYSVVHVRASKSESNVLTQAVILYVFGNTYNEEIYKKAAETYNTARNETHLTREGEIELLNDDFEGQDRLQVLRFLLTQMGIQQFRIFWSELEKLSLLNVFHDPLMQVRLANTTRMLVKAGANARKMFLEMLNSDGMDRFLTLTVLRFFGEECNLDIQSSTQPKIKTLLEGPQFWRSLSSEDVQEFKGLQLRQQKGWELIDGIADTNISLDKLKQSAKVDYMVSQLNELKNRHGRFAIHIAAVNNRIDLVEWLLCEMNVDAHRLDEDGHSAMQLARQAGSHDVARYLEERAMWCKICKFAQTRFRMRKPYRMFRRALSAARVIQAKYRSWLVFRTTRALVDNRLGERQNFLQVWAPLVKALAHHQTHARPASLCWVTLKNSLFDFSRVFEKQEDETRQTVLEATQSAVNDKSLRHSSSPAGNGADQAEAGSSSEDEDAEDGVDDVDKSTARAVVPFCAAHSLDNIMLTAASLSWYKQADPRHSMLFLRRLKQLAAGERSRILNKHLVGSKNFSIFETYLDQGRAALRMLWTECRERNGLRGILVWYVSKHKHVSKYMVQIDEAAMRLNRQPSSARSLFEGDGDDDVMLLDGDTVLLDPMGSTPLKIHEADIRQLASKECLDSLPLRLTSAEKAIIEKSGTVLVLGRSGTGKTICIANKMTYDYRTSARTGRQLFVCRSARVCGLVQRLQHYTINHSDHKTPAAHMQQHLNTPVFMQLDQLVSQHLLRVASESRGQFAAVRRMTYPRFTVEFFDSKVRRSCSLDPLVVWMQIQSFIKGSIEAVMLTRSLQLDEFLELGENRVRLNDLQRRAAFAVFQKYTAFCKQNQCWDDADRILALISRLKNKQAAAKTGTAKEPSSDDDRDLDVDSDHKRSKKASTAEEEEPKKAARKKEEGTDDQDVNDTAKGEEEDVQQDDVEQEEQEEQEEGGGRRGAEDVGAPQEGESSYSKIYVDEVQDLTQAEIALLFMLSKSRSLFLAGDPAQSVVEGVSFRFSEVRSVAYRLKVSVPEKPMVLHLNFRSHTGILNLARAVLDKLFLLFPGAASKLPPDEGLYKGPRPALLQEPEDRLLTLLSQNDGLMLLTHDHAREWLEGLCGSQRVVLGIREAKGLEFPEVAIVDFFSSLDRSDQLQWKHMLSIDDQARTPDVSLRHKFPELETQLKLLYTAITRAERSLYMIETKRSIAGSAFFAFVQARGLAQAQEVLSESLSTHDEWVSRGLDFAITAKEIGNIDEEVAWLRRALVCFDNAGNADMRRRAHAHMRSALLRKKLMERSFQQRLLLERWGLEGDLVEIEVELEAMRAARACIASNMPVEAAELCQQLLPHLSQRSQELLSSELLEPLRAAAPPHLIFTSERRINEL